MQLESLALAEMFARHIIQTKYHAEYFSPETLIPMGVSLFPVEYDLMVTSAHLHYFPSAQAKTIPKHFKSLELYDKTLNAYFRNA